MRRGKTRTLGVPMAATRPPRLIPRPAICVVVVVACVWFLNDALSFGLMPADAISGRARGCYTLVELWLGRLEPSDDIRLAQLAISAILAIGAAIYGVLP